jgi:transcriptional regulator with XRE-family HTH domain
MVYMSQKQSGAYPYKSLGIRLKRLREKLQETLAEVSGAVEIDTVHLTEIEKGSKRPSEDILLLLISHFGMKEEDATTLWELANYEPKNTTLANVTPEDVNNHALMIMPIEPRIIYTDMMHVIVNNYGVVMNFMQGSGPNNQPVAVARIGMSKDHAKSVLEILQKTLAQSDPKGLPASDNSSDKHIKN